MKKRGGNSGHSFLAYFKRATSPLVVLSMLAKRPMYGYELSQEMKRRSGGNFTISVLYPVLYRLEKLGYVKVVRSELVDGRGRCYYAMTNAGREHLTVTLWDYRKISAIFDSFIVGLPENINLENIAPDDPEPENPSPENTGPGNTAPGNIVPENP